MTRAQVLALLAAGAKSMTANWSQAKLISMVRAARMPAPQGLAGLLGAVLRQKVDGDGGKLLRALLGGDDQAERKSQFLQQLQQDAKKALERHAASDELAGATFTWEKPPRVTAVQPGSLAEGAVPVGSTLHTVSDEDVTTMAREEILQLLVTSSSMIMKGAVDSSDAPQGLQGLLQAALRQKLHGEGEDLLRALLRDGHGERRSRFLQQVQRDAKKG